MPKHEPIRIQVVIPFHQPLTASDADMAQACDSCYLPILDAIEAHDNLRVSLHFTGHLLDYLARKREEFLLRIKSLTKRGQVEVLGGLFYGGIPALLPEMDVRGQIEMAGEFWDSFLGVVPKGFWLSELAWTPELPRLVEETGLEYGFIASGQLHMEDGMQRALGSVERGGQRLPAFVLDTALSSTLPSRPVDEWIEAAIDHGSKNPHRLLSVWVRAESLGLEPGTAAWCLDGGWLSTWFAALSERAELEAVLPADTYPAVHPVEPLRLRNVCAAELLPMGDTEGVVDWTDFPFLFAEVDTLYRRMLRASEKLREAIGIMEDDELEDTWSDKLATAQRLVFSSQATDAYWRGAKPGFSDPLVRDATMARLARAEAMIDTLVQGEDDFLSTEESDLDGDLAEEVFVSTRHLLAWLVPARGGDVRCLDDRIAERTVLDVGGRRAEPFFSSMAKAPQRSTGKAAKALARRGESLTRLGGELPTDSDSVVRRGIRQWILEANATATGFFTGAAADLTPAHVPWDVRNNGIDEEGDLSYTLTLAGELALPGGPARTLKIEKDLIVPIDAPELRMRCRLELSGGPPVLWAVEIPTRLGPGAMRLWVNGKTVEASTPSQAADVSELRIEAPDGELMELRCTPSLRVWWLPLRTSVRDLDGYRAIDQGLIVVPHLHVDGKAEIEITLSLVPRPL